MRTMNTSEWEVGRTDWKEAEGTYWQYRNIDYIDSGRVNDCMHLSKHQTVHLKCMHFYMKIILH